LPADSDFALVAGELADNCVTCLFPTRRYERLGRLLFLYRSIRRFRPDIIFAHATIPALYVRALPLRVPIVWVMHSSVNDFLDNGLLQRAERILSLRAKAVIGVSQKHVDEYTNAIGRHPSLLVVPNGVDAARFRKPRGREGGAAESSTGAVKRIVQIGRYVPEKGQIDTLHAFRHVLGFEPDARLLLCGVIEDKPYYSAVAALAEELGIASHVDIAGPQSNVDEILVNSSVFVMPSSIEAQGIAFLEALASGIPIVANVIPSFTFAHNWAGVRLVDTSDHECYGRALVAALGEPRAQRPLDGFMLEDTAERYLAIARQVIG
jgi:glycosyltransferase involved in cell wall biosynthesis